MGPNGQWVRARTEAGAKRLVAEQERERQQRQQAKLRSRAFWRRVWMRATQFWTGRRRG